MQLALQVSQVLTCLVEGPLVGQEGVNERKGGLDTPLIESVKIVEEGLTAPLVV